MLRHQETPPSEHSSGHVLFHVGCVILAFVSQICASIFFILYPTNGPLFTDHSYNVSDSNILEVSMDSWSNYNWIMVDCWTAFWLVEAIVSAWRRNPLGRICCNPEIHPPVFYVLWIIVNVVRISSISLVWRHDLVENVTLVWSLPVFSFFMLSWSYVNLQMHKSWLAINNPNQIWMIRLLTQNGLALFAWWTFMKSAVGLGVMLNDVAEVSDSVASTVTLTIILVAAFIWFVLQCFMLTRFMRDTFTVYPILVLGLGSMFTNSYRVNSFSQNTLYCGFMMLTVTIMSLFHLISACLYQDRLRARPVRMETRMVLHTVYQPDNKQQRF